MLAARPNKVEGGAITSCSLVGKVMVPSSVLSGASVTPIDYKSNGISLYDCRDCIIPYQNNIASINLSHPQTGPVSSTHRRRLEKGMVKRFSPSKPSHDSRQSEFGRNISCAQPSLKLASQARSQVTILSANVGDNLS